MMAVFLVNTCKFHGCGITFRTLGDLIQHIEDTHIDFDPHVLENQEMQQAPCVHLSYILRFFTNAARKENLEMLKKAKGGQSPVVSICCSTPTGSEFDEEELVSESDNSNDSWTTPEEFSSEFILRFGSRFVGSTSSCEEKPFGCPVPGCKKRYKNINGIKYHAKNGHRKDGRVKKAFKCQCGKSYKTAKGLHSHALNQHTGNIPPLTDAMQSTVGEQLQLTVVRPTFLEPSCNISKALGVQDICKIGQGMAAMSTPSSVAYSNAYSIPTNPAPVFAGLPMSMSQPSPLLTNPNNTPGSMLAFGQQHLDCPTTTSISSTVPIVHPVVTSQVNV